MVILTVYPFLNQKTVQPSVEKMYKTSQDFSQSQASKDLPNHTSLDSLSLKAQGDTRTDKHFTSVSSVESGLKSLDMKSKFSVESNIGVNQRGYIKKSQSLGSGLFQEGRVSAGNDTEDETDLELSCEGFHDHKGLAEPDPSKDQGLSPPDEYQENPTLESFRLSPDCVNYESIFSIGDPQHSEKEGHGNSDTPLSGECPGDSGDHTPRTPPLIVKSSSLPNIGASTPTSGRCSPFRHVALQSRSSEDLHILDMRRREISVNESVGQATQEQVKNDGFDKAEKNTLKNSVDYGYDSYSYSGLAKEWIMPVTDEVNPVKNLQGESSVHWWDQLPSKDFKMKRIAEWVNDLQLCSPLEETNESSQSDDQVKRDPNILNSLTAAKIDGKITPGMEAAKKYISSLSAITTTAHLANHGLVMIPFLCAFASLKALNLSGNAIGLLHLLIYLFSFCKNSVF